MGFWMTLLLAFALAMDAFAVALTNGIAHRRRTLRLALCCGCAFSLFQMLMPLIGYIAGASFLGYISALDHWVAAGLLALIGGRMIHGALRDGDGPAPVARFTLRLLILQAVATSIDALAVGVGLGFIQVNLGLTIALIGAVAFVAGFLGVLVGKLFGSRLSGRAELAGGVVLLLIGLRILVEHIFFA